MHTHTRMRTHARVHTHMGPGRAELPYCSVMLPFMPGLSPEVSWETSNYYSLKEDSGKSKITFFLSVTEIYTTFKRLFNYISEISEVMLVSVH